MKRKSFEPVHPPLPGLPVTDDQLDVAVINIMNVVFPDYHGAKLIRDDFLAHYACDLVRYWIVRNTRGFEEQEIVYLAKRLAVSDARIGARIAAIPSVRERRRAARRKSK
jgi:hypothetical protein